MMLTDIKEKRRKEEEEIVERQKERTKEKGMEKR